MMHCGQETTTVPMRRNDGTCCHDHKLPSLDLRRTMPGKESKEERTFKGLDCGTLDPHRRSDYTLTGMRAGCCTSDLRWGRYQTPTAEFRFNNSMVSVSRGGRLRWFDRSGVETSPCKWIGSRFGDLSRRRRTLLLPFSCVARRPISFAVSPGQGWRLIDQKLYSGEPQNPLFGRATFRRPVEYQLMQFGIGQIGSGSGIDG